MSREYDKLVRDRIPEIIRADGERPVTRVVSGEEYRRRLREKVVEEATEYAEDGSVAELADVWAAFEAAVAASDATLDDVRERAARKAAERGGFDEGVVLERVESVPDDDTGGDDSR